MKLKRDPVCVLHGNDDMPDRLHAASSNAPFGEARTTDRAFIAATNQQDRRSGRWNLPIVTARPVIVRGALLGSPPIAGFCRSKVPE